MIAEVVGAVHNPKPELITSSGHSTSKYDESAVSVHIHTKPTDTRSMLANTTARSPNLGRYQDDSAENVNSGTASGARATAVANAV